MSTISIAGDMLRRHEGFSRWAYQDTVGKWTVGIGRNIDKNGGPGITEEEALHLLANDLQNTSVAMEKTFPWFSGMNEARQAAILDMAFNIGLPSFQRFRQTIALLEQENYAAAADEMLRSTWAAQVGARATELAGIIRTGEL